MHHYGPARRSITALSAGRRKAAMFSMLWPRPAAPPAEILIDSSAVRAFRCASGGKSGNTIRRSAAGVADAPPRSTPAGSRCDKAD